MLASGTIKTQDDLCGKHVGTSRSTSFPAEIRTWSAAHCEAAGKPAIEVVNAESTPDARAQLKQGRIDAAVQGSETIPYLMSQEPGTYRSIGGAFSTHYQGIAFLKTQAGFRDAVAAALQGVIADGTYNTILAKWHLTDNAVTAPLINGAALP